MTIAYDMDRSWRVEFDHGMTLEEIEREVTLKTLAECGGNRTRAAAMLGVNVRTIQRHLRDWSAANYRIPACEVSG